MTMGLIVASGILIAGGLVLIVAGLLPTTPHLADSISRIYPNATSAQLPAPRAATRPPAGAPLTERLGSWLRRRTPVPLTAGQLRALQVRGRSVTEFYADKAVWAILGLTMPPILSGFYALMTGSVSLAVPAVVGILGAGVGYFVPDLMLRGKAQQTRNDASSALLMYIDLVTLERLANASATQALQNAAQLSDVPLFRQLRGALERARLEQQAPYTEIRRLADDLDLQELRDLSDVMQLDESGAALSGALRARVRELRDGHLAVTLRDANAASEGMTVYMTIPALLLGVMFIIPALMRIVAT
jgi:hypothetical protein